MDYTKHFNTKETQQTNPIPGRESDMKENRADGYTFKIDQWSQLRRFLVLGSEGGTYYASEKEMTVENANNLVRCAREDGVRVVAEILDVSLNGKAVKNDPAIFALAVVCSFGSQEAKQKAYSAISAVCRTGTHIFTFTENVNKLRGWSKGLCKGVSRFYTERNVDSLVLQVIKYQQRNGWSHKDVVRLAHPSMESPMANNVLRYVVGKELDGPLPAQLVAFESIKNEKDVKNVIAAIKAHRLPRECVPTEHLNSKEVWAALLEDMPMTAMVRNLGKMTSVGLLDSNLSDAVKTVVAKMADSVAVKKSRIHPIQVLLALKTYAKGRGVKGGLTWSPVGKVQDALNDLYYMAFGNVESTGKNFLLGLDVSGSMSWASISGMPLTASEATAALAMVTARTEANYEVMGFCDSFRNLGITAKQSLEDVMKRVSNLTFGTTDCSQPMEYAIKKKLPVDVFCVYTDNETYAGKRHPKQALEDYRQKLGRDAKLIVMATSATDVSIADPQDKNMLDIAGFSGDVPQVISNFANGSI